jgi:hypothetical protein
VRLIHRDDLIAALQDIAKAAREKTIARFAEVQCDAATRRRLDHDLATALDQFDAVIERQIAELDGTAGHA